MPPPDPTHPTDAPTPHNPRQTGKLADSRSGEPPCDRGRDRQAGVVLDPEPLTVGIALDEHHRAGCGDDQVNTAKERPT